MIDRLPSPGAIKLRALAAMLLPLSSGLAEYQPAGTAGWVAELESTPKSTAPVRITFDPGSEILPAWDPRGGVIAFSTDRSPGNLRDLGGVHPDGRAERLLAIGPQSGFGIGGGQFGWIGKSGQLTVNEAVVFHEYLSFDVSKAPYTRAVNDSDDAAFTRKLLVNGGGGGGFFLVSRDGSTALWRYSFQGGGGRTTIRTAPYSTLTGTSAASTGTIHIDETPEGPEQRYLQGAAIAPDASFFILSKPEGKGHDLWLYETSGGGPPVALTSSGLKEGAWNRFPEISPDGRRVAFTRWSGLKSDTNEIYTINIDGSGEFNLTNTENLSEAWPTWSPDGRSIAFGRHDAEGSPDLMPGEKPNTNIYRLDLPEPGESHDRREMIVQLPEDTENLFAAVTVSDEGTKFAGIRFESPGRGAIDKQHRYVTVEAIYKAELSLDLKTWTAAGVDDVVWHSTEDPRTGSLAVTVRLNGKVRSKHQTCFLRIQAIQKALYP